MIKRKLGVSVLLFYSTLVIHAQTIDNGKQEGIRELSDETPTHSSFSINPQQVRKIKFDTKSVGISQRPLKSREQATGFELTYTSATGIENTTSLPNTSNAQDVEDFFRTGFFTGNDVRLLFPSFGKTAFFETNLGQNLKNSPVRNSEFQSYNASLALKNIKYKQFEGEISGAYNTSKGKLLSDGANMASVFSSLLIPSTNIDNPYAVLNALPDKEKGNHWLLSAGIHYKKNNWDGFSADLKGDFQKLSENRKNGNPPGFTPYTLGRISEYETNSTVGNIQFSPYYSYRGSWKFYGDYVFSYQNKDLDYLTHLDYQISPGQFLEDPYHEVRISNELKYGADFNKKIDDIDFLFALSNRHYFSNTASGYDNFFPYAGIKLNLYEIVRKISDNIDDFSLYANAGKSAHEAPLIYNDPSVISTLLHSSGFKRFYESQAIYAVDKPKPEIKKEYNAGLSFLALYYKLQFYIDYFNTTTNNFVASVFNPQSNRFILDNVAKINNAGWNITASYLKYFHYGENSFEINVNWSTYKNEVLETALDEYVPIAGFSNISTGMLKGNPLGAIYGTSWLRDDQGNKILGNDGSPVVNNAISMIGNPIPNWTAGISPRLNIQDFSFDFTVGIRKGGDIWNGTAAALDFAGMAQSTVGQHNTNNVGEDYICDASWIKLSGANLNYKFKLHSDTFSELVIGFSGFNLLTFTKYKGVDPSSSLFNYASGNGLDLFNLPGTRSFAFNLRMKLKN